MPSAEILTIGTEILLGEIVDTNTQSIARRLRDAGIDLFWTSTVGDNEQRIADAIRLGLSRSDIVLCTGGLGPTVDDVTREAIARAVERPLEFREELWEQIKARFKQFRRTPTENNRQQAYVPVGAVALENPVGTAPSFLIEHQGKVVAAMPGVPGEMKTILELHLLPYFVEHYAGGMVIRTRVLHTAGTGESLIDEKIADLERLSNPTVGLAAHTGAVDVRLTAKAATPKEAEKQLADLEKQVRERLGDWIYGVDDETLPGAVAGLLTEKKWGLVIAESGLGGRVGEAFQDVEKVQRLPLKAADAGDMQAQAEALKASSGVEVALLIRFEPGQIESQLDLAIASPQRARHNSFSYGVPGDVGLDWAVNFALARLYRELKRS